MHAGEIAFSGTASCFAPPQPASSADAHSPASDASSSPIGSHGRARCARPERPVSADGGRARLGAARAGRLAVRAEVGRLPRRARERRRRARALVAQRAAAAPLFPGAARGRRAAAAALRARRRDRDRPRREARLRRDADAASPGGEPRPQAVRRDPRDVRRLRPAALEGQAGARAADREAPRASSRRSRRASRSHRYARTSSRRATWLETLQAGRLRRRDREEARAAVPARARATAS